MRNYFYSVFPDQLKHLSYSRPNHIASRAFDVENVLFFGGPDWKNVATDLDAVPASDRPRFLLALFMVVLTDQALYTYSRDAYVTWRTRTALPKFGWTGFGVHHENPLKILWIPERERLVDADKLVAAMPDFVDFLMAETERVIAEYHLPVNPATHFNSIARDPAYGFNEGVVIPAFKAAFGDRRVRSYNA